MSWIGVAPTRSGGLGFEKSNVMKSARSVASSKIALNSKCCITACRRMSTMKAMAGWIPAMYVRFCSGPTPRKTPPTTGFSRSIVKTCPTSGSLEVKLSVRRKKPSGSDIRDTSVQNSTSLRRSERAAWYDSPRRPPRHAPPDSQVAETFERCRLVRLPPTRHVSRHGRQQHDDGHQDSDRRGV